MGDQQPRPTPKTPIEMKELDNDVFEIGGKKFSGDFFRHFVCPDKNAFYRFTDKGETVHIQMTKFPRVDLGGVLHACEACMPKAELEEFTIGSIGYFGKCQVCQKEVEFRDIHTPALSTYIEAIVKENLQRKEAVDLLSNDLAKWDEFHSKVMFGDCICEGTIIKKEHCEVHGKLPEAQEINGILHFILREIYSKEIEEQSPYKLTGAERHDTAHKRINSEVNETLQNRLKHGMTIHCELPANLTPPDIPWGPVNDISDVKVDGKPVEPLPDSMKSSAYDNAPVEVPLHGPDDRQMVQLELGEYPVCCDKKMGYGPGMVYVCGKCGRKIEDKERQAKFKERHGERDV